MLGLRNGSDIVIKYNNKTVIGLVEPVTILGPKGEKQEVASRIDTGATKSSMDIKLAADLSLGPILRTKLVRSASGTGLRAVINATIILAGLEIKSEFTLADRSKMKYPILIGQNILSNGFLIDPSKETEKTNDD